MDKTTLLAELKKQRLVAVIRGKDEEEVTTLWMLYIAVEYISWKSHIQYHRQNR